MSVIKNGKKQTRFTTIDNAPINNINLSYPAVGLLIYVVSKPENWEIRISDLMKRQKPGAKPGTPCGKQMIQSILKELQAAGHAKLQSRRDETGKVCGKEWVFYEEPITDNAVNRSSVQPTVGQTDDRATRPISKERVISNKREEVNTYTHTQREKIGNPDLSQTTDSPEIQSPKTPPVAPPPPVVEKHVNNPDPVEIITSKILSNDMYLDRWRNLNGLPDETITAEARKCARNWIGRNCIGLSDSDVVYNANRTGAFIFISRFESWVAQMDKYNAPPQPRTKPVRQTNKYGV